MIFLFSRWDMLIPWLVYYPVTEVQGTYFWSMLGGVSAIGSLGPIKDPLAIDAAVLPLDKMVGIKDTCKSEAQKNTTRVTESSAFWNPLDYLVANGVITVISPISMAYLHEFPCNFSNPVVFGTL